MSFDVIKTDSVEADSSHTDCINFPQIRLLMKSYSFIRETAPAVMKNTPKEGTVPYCIDVRCFYSSGGIITHSDIPRQQRKMTKTNLSRFNT